MKTAFFDFILPMLLIAALLAFLWMAAQPAVITPPRISIVAPARLAVPERAILIEDSELATPGQFAADHRSTNVATGGVR